MATSASRKSGGSAAMVASNARCSNAASGSARGEPEAAFEQRELLATIAALPPDFRDALVAIDVVGLSYREAARRLGVPEATITTRLYRARQRVAHTLTGKDRAAAAAP